MKYLVIWSVFAFLTAASTLLYQGNQYYAQQQWTAAADQYEAAANKNNEWQITA